VLKPLTAALLGRAEYALATDHERLLVLTAYLAADDYGRGRQAVVAGLIMFGSDPAYLAGVFARASEHGLVHAYGRGLYCCPSWFSDPRVYPDGPSAFDEPPAIDALSVYLESCRAHESRIAARVAFQRDRRETNRSVAAGYAMDVERIELQQFTVASGGVWGDHLAKEWRTLYLAIGREPLAELIARLRRHRAHVYPLDVIRDYYGPKKP
jgi:hypothetical protein